VSVASGVFRRNVECSITPPDAHPSTVRSSPCPRKSGLIFRRKPDWMRKVRRMPGAREVKVGFLPFPALSRRYDIGLAAKICRHQQIEQRHAFQISATRSPRIESPSLGASLDPGARRSVAATYVSVSRRRMDLASRSHRRLLARHDRGFRQRPSTVQASNRHCDRSASALVLRILQGLAEGFDGRCERMMTAPTTLRCRCGITPLRSGKAR
jgi:hypothetical protein